MESDKKEEVNYPIINGISFKPKPEEDMEKYYNKVFNIDIPKSKNKLIIEILKRWWYGFSWPNQEINYQTELENYLKENKITDKTYKPLPGYPGVFQNNDNNIIDLRKAIDLKPSFNSLKSMEIKDLAQLLKKCLKHQLIEFKDNEVNDKYFYTNLKIFYKKFLKSYENILNN